MPSAPSSSPPGFSPVGFKAVAHNTALLGQLPPPPPPPPPQIEEERRELDKALRSTNAREKLDGLKRLIGMMSSGKDVSSFFAAVVMNLAQDSFELKVLVYIYLVRTAEQKADEALLSINSFQKDLVRISH